MKKTMPILLALFLLPCLLAGCGKTQANGKSNSPAKKISVVSTIFPSYDFARQVAGDRADLTMLLAPGAESHSYEPTPQDIVKIKNCDLFLYVGGESDAWVKDVLDSVDQSKMQVIKLLDCVDAVEEETVEGMESEKEEEPAETEEAEYDEHVWTSPKNAIKIVERITEVLSSLDEANKQAYTENAQAYVQKLRELDGEFETVVAAAKRKTVVFGDRFPLRYFVEAYGLTYYAAFPGCSTETEPSSATVAFLIDKVKKEKIPVVFYIELSNEKMADTICEATNAKKLLFHTCHNVSKDDFQNGETYLSLMRRNVDVLKEALN